MCVQSQSWKEHLIHLGSVLHAFGSAGRTLRLSNCLFAKSLVKFFGRLVGSGEICLLPDRVDALKRLLSPKTKKVVRSILDMFGFFQHFVPHFSEIAEIH